MQVLAARRRLGVPWLKPRRGGPAGKDASAFEHFPLSAPGEV